jgi:two-component system, cell cycle response regulator DivK
MASLHIKQQEHLAITVSTVVIYRHRPILPVKVSQLQISPTIDLIVDFVLVNRSSTMTSGAATVDLGNQASDSPTILVIEDYLDTRQMISMLLRRRGYNVIEAGDGVEGLLKANWKHPDLILMDLALPEMDGIEATRRIHATPRLADIPIIVLSAYLNEAVERDVLAAGCVEMFPKPFDAESFLECIEITLQKRRVA